MHIYAYVSNIYILEEKEMYCWYILFYYVIVIIIRKLVEPWNRLGEPREQAFNTHSVMVPNQYLLFYKAPLANIDKIAVWWGPVLGFGNPEVKNSERTPLPSPRDSQCPVGWV